MWTHSQVASAPAPPDRMSGSDAGLEEEPELSITLTLRMLMHGKVSACGGVLHCGSGGGKVQGEARPGPLGGSLILGILSPAEPLPQVGESTGPGVLIPC